MVEALRSAIAAIYQQSIDQIKLPTAFRYFSLSDHFMNCNSKAFQDMANNPNSNDKIKDKIQFSIQGGADMANVTIAVAVGLFGILSILVVLQTSDRETHFGQLWWFMKDPWHLLPAFFVLTAAYFGISLLGFTCFVYRRQFEGLTAYYSKKNITLNITQNSERLQKRTL